MAGPDQARWVSQLKARAQALGLADRITWPGMLQGTAKWGACYSSDAFTLPSHQENFGIAIAALTEFGCCCSVPRRWRSWMP
jgi:hypothetical protein